MSNLDVVVKTTDPVRIAERVGVAAGFGEHLKPLFERLVPEVLAHLGRSGVRPGIMIAWYEDPDDDGSIVLHVGFDVGDQPVSDGDGVAIVDLPSITVAAAIHRGSMDEIESVYEGLVRWIEDSGHQLAGRSRELYHEWDEARPDRSVTELQIPITS